MEGDRPTSSRSSSPEHFAQQATTSSAPTTTTNPKMVETDSQSQLPSVPAVPEQGESTTTNPSMNGLEAHFTNGGGAGTIREDATITHTGTELPGPVIAATASSASTNPNATTTTTMLSVTSANVQDPRNTQPAEAGTSSATSASTDNNTGKGSTRKDAAAEGGETATNNTMASTASASVGPPPEKRVGCAHYKRRAKFVTPCCNKLYMCRYCHDEHETHYFNRKTVTQLICTECDTRQRVQAECETCGVRFGKVSKWGS